jgi:hypothetical protein
MDRHLGLTEAMAKIIPDPRDPARCEHRPVDLIRQRVYGLALGYEDLNDHQTLRQDVALQTALGREEVLASPSTLCRFEHQANRQVAWALNRLWVEQFIASFEEPPKELILDFDATDDPVHGRQEGRFFHGYYDRYCFLPLYVFCGDQLLVSYLRPSHIDGAKHAWAILALSSAFGKSGPRCGLSSEGTAAFAVLGCLLGVSARGWITSWGWPKMRG